MTLVGKNIRKIRTIKGLSQTAFANLFNLTRASVSAYEEGRAEPKVDVTLQIAKKFSIPVETLLSKEITVNEFANFNLQKFIGNEPLVESKSIRMISSNNWDEFIENGVQDAYPNLSFPPGYIQGEIAFEVHEKISSPYSNGTLLIGIEESSLTENNVYLIIEHGFGAVKSYSDLQITPAMKVYRILHLITEPIGLPANDLETRVLALERKVSKLQGKK